MKTITDQDREKARRILANLRDLRKAGLSTYPWRTQADVLSAALDRGLMGIELEVSEDTRFLEAQEPTEEG